MASKKGIKTLAQLFRPHITRLYINGDLVLTINRDYDGAQVVAKIEEIEQAQAIRLAEYRANLDYLEIYSFTKK